MTSNSSFLSLVDHLDVCLYESYNPTKESTEMMISFYKEYREEFIEFEDLAEKILAKYYSADYLKLIDPKIKNEYKESLIEQILEIEEKEADIKFKYGEFGKYLVRGRHGLINNLYTLVEDWNYIIPSNLNLKRSEVNKFVLLRMYRDEEITNES